jgi:AcrR family transcriptional regulator
MSIERAPRGTTKAAETPRRKPRRGAYHHGDLRRALIDAALELAREGGADAVTVREVARRAGVSPGAPFRHFSDRTMLMTALAEEAMRRLRAEIAAGLAAARSRDPLRRLHAMGTAYLRWAIRNPTHFQIVSQRDSIDFDGSATLTGGNAELQSLMLGLFGDAQAQRRLRMSDLPLAIIMSRAFVYGLARMHADGHFPSWNVAPEEAEAVMARALRVFVDLFAQESPGADPRRPGRRVNSRARRRRS